MVLVETELERGGRVYTVEGHARGDEERRV